MKESRETRETSIRRGIEVLLTLGSAEAHDGGGLGVTRIAEIVGRDKSQVSRALTTLADYGLVERIRGERGYRLGWQIHVLADRARRPRLLAEGGRIVGDIVDEIEETVSVIVRSGDELLTVASRIAERSIKAVAWVGASGPILPTAAGRAMISGESREQFDALVERVPPVVLTDKTTLDPDVIWERVVAGRERGFWVVEEEYDLELCGIAAPIHDPSGEVAAVIGTAGPRYRFADRIDAIGRAIKGGADAVAAELRAEAAEPGAGG